VSFFALLLSLGFEEVQQRACGRVCACVAFVQKDARFLVADAEKDRNPEEAACARKKL
jgi:hypothetical protein